MDSTNCPVAMDIVWDSVFFIRGFVWFAYGVFRSSVSRGADCQFDCCADFFDHSGAAGIDCAAVQAVRFKCINHFASGFGERDSRRFVAMDCIGRRVALCRHQRSCAGGLFHTCCCHRCTRLFQNVLALGVCVWVSLCLMGGINDIVAAQGWFFCHCA